LYKEKHGGGYFIIRDEEENKPWLSVKNNNYSKLPKIINAKPKELAHFGIRFKQPIYKMGIKNMGLLEFLSKPEEYLDLLSADELFNVTREDG
jgi:hypothetical protein